MNTYATFAINKIKRARLTVDLCVLWIVVIEVKQKKKHIFKLKPRASDPYFI